MEIKIKKLLLMFLLIITSGKLAAQDMNYTLEEAIQYALKNNTEIKLAHMEVKKAGAAVDEAFGYALPSLDLSANFTHFLKKPKMAFPDFEALLTNATYSILFDENVIPYDANKFRPIENTLQSFVLANSFETTVQLTQTLFNSAVFRGIGASKVYANLSKEALKDQVSKTVLDVKKAFYGVLLTKNLVDISKASFENANKNLKNVRALNQQGLVSEFDYLQAEVQVENLRPVVLEMENNLKNAKEGFKLVLGIPQSEMIDVIGEFKYEAKDYPELSDLVSESIQSNYGIKTLDFKMQVDEAFIDLDLAEYWPNLAAFGNYSFAGQSDNWDFQNYSSATVGLSFSINLWKGNRTKNKVEQSTISFKQTKEQFQQLKDFVSSQVKAKYYDLQKVKELISVQERNVTVAERAYYIATVRYKEGTGSQLEVQNADFALRQARINRLNSIHSYIIAKAELDQLLGNLNPDYLEKFFNED